MDWNRAQTILIAAFFTLNIFLGFHLWQNLNENTTGGNISEQLMLNYLHKNQITLDAFSVQEQKVMSPLIVTLSAMPSEWQKQTDASYKYTSKIAIKFNDTKEIDNWLQDNIPFFENLKKVEQTENGIEYHQIENSNHFFDARLVVKLNEQLEIASINMTHFQILQEAQKVKIKPFYIALLKLIRSGEIHTKSTITNAILGYKCISNAETEHYYLIPYWRITINNEKGEKHCWINAINNR